jgi:ketosteroid isomerase-like protein
MTRIITKIVFLLTLMAFIIVFSGCGNNPKLKDGQDMQADKQTEAAVMAVFHKFYEAYTANDLSKAMGTLVQDPNVVFLGAGQDERNVGPLEARSQMERDLSQAEKISFKEEWHHVSALGDIAWMVTDGTLSWMAGGTQESALSRISVVFVKQNGQWLIAQFHFSFIELRQAEGQSFPS